MKEFLARSIAYLTRNDDQALPGEGAPVRKQINAQLAVAYVVDEAGQLQFVQQADLEASGMTADELHALALANLDKFSAKRLELQQHGPVFGAMLDGNFEASQILLTRLWQKDLAHLVARGFAIAIPARNVLTFCDMDNAEAIGMLKDMIARVSKGTRYPLSEAVFQIRKQA